MAFCFLFQEAAAAAPGIAAAPVPAPVAAALPISQLVRNPAQIDIPFNAVTLQEVHAGTSGKLIIHIQDAHANLSGQESLSKALEHFVERYGLKVVLVEGADRDVTLDPVRKLAPLSEWKIVARRFLYEGIISGEEYLNLTTEHPIKLRGVEYQDLYDEAVKTYAALVDRRKDILHYLYQAKTSLERLKAKMYPAELLDYERSEGSGDLDNGAGFAETLKALFALAEGAGMGLEEYPALARLKTTMDQERSVNFERANQEQAQILSRLDGDAARAFAEASRRLRYSQVSQYRLTRQLLKQAEERGIAAESFPELAAYAEYLEQFLGLRMEQVMVEQERFEDRVFEMLLPDDDARKVRAIDRFLGLLGNAYKLQMSSHDFAMYEFNEKDFPTESWLAFMNRRLADLGFFESLVPTEECLEEAHADFKKFYQLVSDRDGAFVENAGKIMSEEKADAAVLIAGGYHTEHLTELLRANGDSYLVLTPIVTDKTDHEKYENILLRHLKDQQRKLEARKDTGLGRAENVSATRIPRGIRAAPAAYRWTQGGLDPSVLKFTGARLGLAWVDKLLAMAAGIMSKSKPNGPIAPTESPEGLGAAPISTGSRLSAEQSEIRREAQKNLAPLIFNQSTDFIHWTSVLGGGKPGVFGSNLPEEEFQRILQEKASLEVLGLTMIGGRSHEIVRAIPNIATSVPTAGVELPGQIARQEREYVLADLDRFSENARRLIRRIDSLENRGEVEARIGGERYLDRLRAIANEPDAQARRAAAFGLIENAVNADNGLQGAARDVVIGLALGYPVLSILLFARQSPDDPFPVTRGIVSSLRTSSKHFTREQIDWLTANDIKSAIGEQGLTLKAISPFDFGVSPAENSEDLEGLLREWRVGMTDALPSALEAQGGFANREQIDAVISVARSNYPAGSRLPGSRPLVETVKGDHAERNDRGVPLDPERFGVMQSDGQPLDVAAVLKKVVPEALVGTFGSTRYLRRGDVIDWDRVNDIDLVVYLDQRPDSSRSSEILKQLREELDRASVPVTSSKIFEDLGDIDVTAPAKHTPHEPGVLTFQIDSERRSETYGELLIRDRKGRSWPVHIAVVSADELSKDYSVYGYDPNNGYSGNMRLLDQRLNAMNISDPGVLLRWRMARFQMSLDRVKIDPVKMKSVNWGIRGLYADLMARFRTDGLAALWEDSRRFDADIKRYTRAAKLLYGIANLYNQDAARRSAETRMDRLEELSRLKVRASRETGRELERIRGDLIHIKNQLTMSGGAIETFADAREERVAGRDAEAGARMGGENQNTKERVAQYVPLTDAERDALSGIRRAKQEELFKLAESLAVEFPDYHWRDAAEVTWQQLVRTAGPESGPGLDSATDQYGGEMNQWHYWINQIEVRAELLRFIRDILAGEAVPEDGMLRQLQSMHRTLILGQDENRWYWPETTVIRLRWEEPSSDEWLMDPVQYAGVPTFDVPSLAVPDWLKGQVKKEFAQMFSDLRAYLSSPRIVREDRQRLNAVLAGFENRREYYPYHFAAANMSLIMPTINALKLLKGYGASSHGFSDLQPYADGRRKMPRLVGLEEKGGSESGSRMSAEEYQELFWERYQYLRKSGNYPVPELPDYATALVRMLLPGEGTEAEKKIILNRITSQPDRSRGWVFRVPVGLTDKNYEASLHINAGPADGADRRMPQEIFEEMDRLAVEHGFYYKYPLKPGSWGGRGDTFVVYLSGTSADRASEIADRIGAVLRGYLRDSGTMDGIGVELSPGVFLAKKPNMRDGLSLMKLAQKVDESGSLTAAISGIFQKGEKAFDFGSSPGMFQAVQQVVAMMDAGAAPEDIRAGHRLRGARMAADPAARSVLKGFEGRPVDDASLVEFMRALSGLPAEEGIVRGEVYLSAEGEPVVLTGVVVRGDDGEPRPLSVKEIELEFKLTHQGFSVPLHTGEGHGRLFWIDHPFTVISVDGEAKSSYFGEPDPNALKDRSRQLRAMFPGSEVRVQRADRLAIKGAGTGDRGLQGWWESEKRPTETLTQSLARTWGGILDNGVLGILQGLEVRADGGSFEWVWHADAPQHYRIQKTAEGYAIDRASETPGDPERSWETIASGLDRASLEARLRLLRDEDVKDLVDRSLEILGEYGSLAISDPVNGDLIFSGSSNESEDAYGVVRWRDARGGRWEGRHEVFAGFSFDKQGRSVGAVVAGLERHARSNQRIVGANGLAVQSISREIVSFDGPLSEANQGLGVQWRFEFGSTRRMFELDELLDPDTPISSIGGLTERVRSGLADSGTRNVFFRNMGRNLRAMMRSGMTISLLNTNLGKDITAEGYLGDLDGYHQDARKSERELLVDRFVRTTLAAYLSLPKRQRKKAGRQFVRGLFPGSEYMRDNLQLAERFERIADRAEGKGSVDRMVALRALNGSDLDRSVTRFLYRMFRLDNPEMDVFVDADMRSAWEEARRMKLDPANDHRAILSALQRQGHFMWSDQRMRGMKLPGPYDAWGSARWFQMSEEQKSKERIGALLDTTGLFAAQWILRLELAAWWAERNRSSARPLEPAIQSDIQKEITAFAAASREHLGIRLTDARSNLYSYAVPQEDDLIEQLSRKFNIDPADQGEISNSVDSLKPLFVALGSLDYQSRERWEPADMSRSAAARMAPASLEVTVTDERGSDVRVTLSRPEPADMRGINSSYKYLGSDGKEYFVKMLNRPSQAVSEFLGHRLFDLLGLPVPEMYKVVPYRDGESTGHALVSPYLLLPDSYSTEFTPVPAKIAAYYYFAQSVLNNSDARSQNILSLEADGEGRAHVRHWDWRGRWGEGLDLRRIIAFMDWEGSLGNFYNDDGSPGQREFEPGLDYFRPGTPQMTRLNVNGLWNQHKRQVEDHRAEFIRDLLRVRSDFMKAVDEAVLEYPSAFGDGSEPWRFEAGELRRKFDGLFDGLQTELTAARMPAPDLRGVDVRLPADRFGTDIDLADVFEKAVRRVVGEDRAPLISFYGSLTYARDALGGIDWDAVGDIDLRVHLAGDRNEEERIDLTHRIMKEFFISLKARMGEGGVRAPGIDDDALSRFTMQQWSVRSLDDRLYRVHLAVVSEDALLAEENSFEGFHVQDMFMGDLNRLRALIDSKGDGWVARRMADWYRQELKTIRSDARDPMVFGSLETKLIKKLYRLAVLVGEGQEQRGWLEAYKRLEKDYSDQAFGSVFVPALEHLEELSEDEIVRKIEFAGRTTIQPLAKQRDSGARMANQATADAYSLLGAVGSLLKGELGELDVQELRVRIARVAEHLGLKFAVQVRPGADGRTVIVVEADRRAVAGSGPARLVVTSEDLAADTAARAVDLAGRPLFADRSIGSTAGSLILTEGIDEHLLATIAGQMTRGQDTRIPVLIRLRGATSDAIRSLPEAEREAFVAFLQSMLSGNVFIDTGVEGFADTGKSAPTSAAVAIMAGQGEGAQWFQKGSGAAGSVSPTVSPLAFLLVAAIMRIQDPADANRLLDRSWISRIIRDPSRELVGEMRSFSGTQEALKLVEGALIAQSVSDFIRSFMTASGAINWSA